MSDEQQTPQEPRPEDKILNELKEKGEELKGTLKEWGIDLDQFLNRANQAGEDAKSQFMKAVNDLQAAVDQQEGEKPTSPPTEQTKDAVGDFFKEMDAAFSDIQAGFKAAGERLHKQLDTAIERSKETAEERGDRLSDEADDMMDRISKMADDMTDEDE
ncbi:MAG: hypothetical protein KC546_09715 [Anaerolineae bacterium]|nr:hypothetical protein [Anaerolineae bacterium]MCA9888641.1 hypothetical protein [Anaerolineae bacterium]